MTEKLKTKQGETDVRRDDSTLLYSPNVVDLSNARIGRRGGKSEWDEFQLFGTSNADESERSGSGEDADQALMKRIRDCSIGRKIKQLDLKIA